MRIYVASSWRNNYQPDVVQQLRSAGHDVYDFKNPAPGNDGFHWSEIDPDWQQWDARRFIHALDHPIAISGFGLDWNAMREADACVLVLPCGRSAHIEAGYFVGAKKPLLIYLPEPVEPELMYKMADTITAGFGDLLERLDEIENELPGIRGSVRPDGQPDPV